MADLSQYDPIIESAASEWNVHPNLIRAVMSQESNARPGAVSPVGAVGLMQVMPDTARDLGVTDIHDPVQNIYAGAKYLSQGMDAEGSPEGGLLYYHGGPDWRKNYGPESAGYVPGVAAKYAEIQKRYPGHAGQSAPSPKQDAATPAPAGHAALSDDEFLKQTGGGSSAHADDDSDFLARTGGVVPPKQAAAAADSAPSKDPVTDADGHAVSDTQGPLSALKGDAATAGNVAAAIGARQAQSDRASRKGLATNLWALDRTPSQRCRMPVCIRPRLAAAPSCRTSTMRLSTRLRQGLIWRCVVALQRSAARRLWWRRVVLNLASRRLAAIWRPCRKPLLVSLGALARMCPTWRQKLSARTRWLALHPKCCPRVSRQPDLTEHHQSAVAGSAAGSGCWRKSASSARCCSGIRQPACGRFCADAGSRIGCPSGWPIQPDPASAGRSRTAARHGCTRAAVNGCRGNPWRCCAGV
jgi:hypothetical protein